MPTSWGYGADGLRLGLGKGVNRQQGARLLAARGAGGEFSGLGDPLAGSGLSRAALENLARCRGLDGLPDVYRRREALWRIGAGYQVGVGRGQLALPSGDAAVPAGPKGWGRVEETLAEYELMRLCPEGHIWSCCGRSWARM